MKLLILTGLLLMSFTAGATPAQIVIIRHGEKPAQGNELNSQGCERAFMLPNFFESNEVVNQFGKPVAIYAQKPDSADGSLRPIQTITPTARALGLDVMDPFTRKPYAPIVKQILEEPAYDGKTVLIAWEHTAIPGLAEAFGVKLTSETKTWPSWVFDQAWILDFTQSPPEGHGRHHQHDQAESKKKTSAPTPTLQIVAEEALPTDSGPNSGDGLSDWRAKPLSHPSFQLPSSVISECANNNELNQLVQALVTPALASAP